MRQRFRTRPRLATAAVLTLAGGLLGAAAPPAQAECIWVDAYVYWNKQGRDYVVEEDCVHDMPWMENTTPTVNLDEDIWWLPPGIPVGGGVEAGLTQP